MTEPRRCWVLLILLVALAWPWPAHAHGRDTSHARWQLPPTDGGPLEVAVRISAKDFERFAGASEIVACFEVEACAPQLDTLTSQRNGEGEWLLRWRMHCEADDDRDVRVRLFERLGPAHVHMLGVEGRAGLQVLTIAAPTGTLARTDAPREWTAFVALGCAHMLDGWDHLAFVLALLLAATRLREVALLVTGFTLGHSVTLLFAALGIARPDPGAVELLIAASVVIVAIEDLDRRTVGTHANAVALALLGAALLAAVRGHASALAAAGAAAFAWGYLRTRSGDAPPRPTLVAAFGLIHGAGFAGVLQDAGLPASGRVLSLLSFNLGVELGQLGFVVLAWPLVRLARARGLALERPLALALVALGMAWVLLRAW